MKALITVGLAFASVASTAQTVNFNQVPHIQTALNHLTVIELGEPVIKVEIADRVAFEVERYDDQVALTPLKSDVATNLFIWTSTREISYEIDPASDVAKMNVIIRNVPRDCDPVEHAVFGPLAKQSGNALDLRPLAAAVKEVAGTRFAKLEDRGIITGRETRF